MKWSPAFLAVVLLAGCDRAAAPLTQDAYVWQRQWTPELIEAIDAKPDGVTGLLPLAAEVRWEAGEARFESFHVSGLSPTPSCRGPVIRVFESCAATRWEPAACDAFIEICRTALVPFGGSATELQIDYDCPTSKLEDYARLLGALKEAFPELTLSLTALPTWLDAETFSTVIRSVDRYVLQVHSVTMQGMDAPPILCDPEAARRAVIRAGRLKVPFQVALPTHSHGVIFRERDGALLDVFSEDLPSAPVRGVVRLASANPIELADLVQTWQSKRPPSMTGLIWFRLPVESDRMNWPRSTWEIVMRGEAPISKWTIMLRPEPSGFSTVLLKNEGERPEPLPQQVRAQSTEPIPAGDGSNGYQFDRSLSPLAADYFRVDRDWRDALPIAPGEARPIGWLRSEGLVLFEVNPNY